MVRALHLRGRWHLSSPCPRHPRPLPPSPPAATRCGSLWSQVSCFGRSGVVGRDAGWEAPSSRSWTAERCPALLLLSTGYTMVPGVAYAVLYAAGTRRWLGDDAWAAMGRSGEPGWADGGLAVKILCTAAAGGCGMLRRRCANVCGAADETEGPTLSESRHVRCEWCPFALSACLAREHCTYCH